MLEQTGRWTAFAARALISAAQSVVHPGWWGRSLYSVVMGGLPLAALAGLALGIVIWIHTRGALMRTTPDAVEYLPTLLAAAVLLELAPIGAGLIVAARTGSQLGAELASFRIGEQVDALEMMGVSPWQRLIGPRVLACIVGTPVLQVVIAVVALTSGYLAESIVGDSTWLSYQRAVLEELYLGDVLPAALKTFVFGALVGITGCFVGLNAQGGAEGVGQATTQSVVSAVVLVLLADVLLVGAIHAVQGFL